jgi:hypothetical protein
MSRDLIAAVVILLLASPLRLLAQAPTTQPSKDVEAVIAQLSTDGWKARQQAQERLVGMGPAVVERLKQLVRETQDEEVRSRAETALRQIEANDYSGPTLITLHLNNAPLPMVIGELAKQAGTEISLWPPMNPQQNPPTLSINVDRQPFWLAVREICEKTGLTPERMGGPQQTITLMQRGQGNWAKKPIAVHEGSLITAERAYRSHSIDYASQNINSSFSIQFRILLDPKLRVLQRPYQIKLDEAIDDKGNSLVLPVDSNQGVVIRGGWDAEWICDVNANLKYQPDFGKRITSLRGSARFVTVSKNDSWQIPDILNAKDVEHAMPMGKYTLHEVNKTQDGQYQADILIEHTGIGFPPQNPLIDFGTIQHCVRLVDADGGVYMPGGGSGNGIGANRMRCQIRFITNNINGRNLGPPAKLVWDIPVELKEILVPIQFKDLPIP